MKIFKLTIIFFLFTLISKGQTVKVDCKTIYDSSYNPNSPDTAKQIYGPVIFKTCFLKNFKFTLTGYPDQDGAYTWSDYGVYILLNNRYIKTINSKVFNQNQNKLLAIINDSIQQDFKNFSSDPNSKGCFIGMDSIPIYKMDDLIITFEENEIWFEVDWDVVSSRCRNVDGTIVSFTLDEIKKYLN